MADDIDLQKQQIRARVRARRAELSVAERLASGASLSEQLVRLVTARNARSLSSYMPVGSEPDIRDFIAWADAEGLDVLFPSSRDDGLLDWIRPTGNGMVTGKYGIHEPLGTLLSPLAVSDVDLMLIPACAVDRTGMRLGWGRGYFDRTLGSMENRPPVFAVIYDEDLLDAVPRDVHDVAVSGIVTPTRIVSLDDGKPRDSPTSPGDML